MEELKKVLASLLSEKLYQIIISNPRQKAGAFKIKVRPVMVKEQVVFQQTVYEGTKVFHDNLDRQTKDGRVVHARYDKFRQINRYLEFVEDVLPVFEKEESIHIIDFGCGKSYLTFALYYYLHELKKRGDDHGTGSQGGCD